MWPCQWHARKLYVRQYVHTQNLHIYKLNFPHLQLSGLLILLFVTLSFQWAACCQENILEILLANWIIPKSQPCNSIVMFDFFPTAGHMNNQTCLHAICKHSLYTTDQGKWYLSPGIGHSGTGAPFPIFIVISLGRMRRFSFPIWNNVKKKPERRNSLGTKRHVYFIFSSTTLSFGLSRRFAGCIPTWESRTKN